jgi:hypothetical protein
VVRRSTTSGSGFIDIATLGANTTSYADVTGLSASTTYYYRVYSTNGTGNSGFSNEASATTNAPPGSPGSPPAPAVIDSFVVTQNGVVTNETNFSPGDTVTITVNASDPNNLPLEYLFIKGSVISSETLQDWSATNSLTYTFLEEDAANGFAIFFGVKNNDGFDAAGFFGDDQGSASFNITGLPSPASILVSWDENPETAVNRSGGGYKVYYSTNSGFNPGDVGVTEIDVPYSSGESAPTSVLLSLSTGTYYIRVAAYSALNAPGASDGSISTATPQIAITAP